MKVKILLPLLLLIMFFSTGCQKEQDSPETALNEIRIALNKRDLTKLSERVDVDKFFSVTYDDATKEITEHYFEYKAKYPEDPYFQHDVEFIEKYNIKNKTEHLWFAEKVKYAYLARAAEPDQPQENPAAYVANELEKISKASEITIRGTRIEGDEATLIVDIQDSNDFYKDIIGDMTFKLHFTRGEDKLWHFEKIENMDELMPIFVDKAEMLWINNPE
ncbi:MAG: hypothetical protein K6G55_01610 [Selenomonadaceae bacterium]|nr:hypothetical protein [Selenomonadaceae bacterium]